MSTVSNLSRSVHCKHSLITIALLLIILITSLIIYTPTTRGDSSLEIDPFFECKTSLKDAIHVASEEELRVALTNAPTNKHITIALDNDIALTKGSIVINADQDITIVSNKNTWFYRLIGATKSTSNSQGASTYYETVRVDGVLRLDGVIVTHAEGIISTGVSVGASGTLIMYDGEISGNNNPRAHIASGSFTFGTGGGVGNSGVFVMFGGKIINNTANSGGGVCGGNFIMYGGVISGNYAKYHSTSSSNVGGYGGGGVYGGNFSMYGGTISGNRADYDGGGVLCGIFSMYGGTISNNHANRNGGGVYAGGSGSFTMFDGVIAGNRADVSDDNVWGVVERFGGEIYDNTDNNSLSYTPICITVGVMIIAIVVIVGFLFLYFKARKSRLMSGYSGIV